MSKVISEPATVYNINQEEDLIIEKAIAILDARIKHGDFLDSPAAVRDYLRLQLAGEKVEMFCCLFLDNRNRVIEFKCLFKGTIDRSSVFPREVVRETINVNAASLIIAHNHPSGNANQSHADVRITKTLVKALELIDVKVLDHFVIGDKVVSFAERGLI